MPWLHVRGSFRKPGIQRLQTASVLCSNLLLTQVVKVIGPYDIRPHRRHRRTVQSYSPDGANVPTVRAPWRHLANTIELVLQHTQVHSPNGKSIGSAVSAQLTTKSAYTLQWGTLSPKIAPSHGRIRTHIFHDSLNQTEPTVQTASRSVQLFSHR